MSESASRLAALVDAAPLPEEEAKALWREFSEHMEANRGDMAGFAAKKGWRSIAPEYRGGKAVLVVRTTATDRAPLPAQAPQEPRPQQKPRSKPGERPQQKPKARPQASQRGPQRPNQPLKPRAHGGGGQVPPKKRSV